MPDAAERLRTAAARMRALAEAATPGEPGWYAGRKGRSFEAEDEVYSSREPTSSSSDICSYANPEDAAYIAAMHPAVALTVADWLESVARQWDGPKCDDPRGCCNNCSYCEEPLHALAVADAFLGATP